LLDPKNKGRVIGHDKTGNYTFEVARVPHQRRKKRPHSISNTGILRVQLQHQEDEDQRTITKNNQIAPKDQTSDFTNGTILPMDSKLTKESYLHDTSSRRSPCPHSISSKRSSTVITPEPESLGKEMHHFSQSQQEFQWWETFATTKNGLLLQSIPLQQPKVTIYTDSSETSWRISSPMVQTFGYWKEEEKKTSINVRELKAVLFALQLHAKKNTKAIH
jgi:hypothetical protein